jgi:hypothetical protein
VDLVARSVPEVCRPTSAAAAAAQLVRTRPSDDLNEVEAFVARTTRASGVPLLVADAVVIERVATLLRGGGDDG